MPLPLKYNFRNVTRRSGGTLMAAGGVGLAAFMLVTLGAMAAGLQHSIVATGSPENVLVHHKGAPPEWSRVGRDAMGVVSFYPEARCASPEFFNTIWYRLPDGHDTLISVRGVDTAQTACVYPMVHATAGHLPSAGSEVALGKQAARRLGLTVGQPMRFGRRTWSIVGLFDAGATTFESEIWAPLGDVQNDFQKDYISSIVLKLRSSADVAAVREKVTSDKRLDQLEAEPEQAFYEQASQQALGLKALSIVVALLMAIGAMFGALNTLYTAVSSRTSEIGMLRVIGFSRAAILGAFLIESLLLALLGGALGAAVGLLSSQFTSSFFGLVFQFRVTPAIFLMGLALSAVIGLLGGLLPALRAARTAAVAALRV